MTEPPQGPSPIPGVVYARPVSLTAAPKPPRFDLSRLTRRAAALDLALVLLVALVVPFGMQLVALLVMSPGAAMEMPPPALLMVSKCLEALLVGGLAAYLLWRHNLPGAALGVRADGWAAQLGWSLATLVGVYVAFFCGLVLISGLVLLIPAWQTDLEARRDFIDVIFQFEQYELVLMLVAVAIHEELLFRGLLIPYLRRIGCGWTVAVLISTTIFALLHGAQGWLGIAQIFWVGAALGIFFVLSRSLPAVVFAHLVFDLLQVQLARLIPWVDELARAAEQAGGG